MKTSEQRYREYGADSQRRYPNQELVRFMSRNYFKLSREERGEVKVLEIGAGSAGNLWFLAKEGFHVFGIDEAETGIAYGNEVLARWGVSGELVVGDMKALPFADATFDVIFDIASLQHVSDKAQVLAQVERCLKPGGRFYSYHLHPDTTLVFADDPYTPLTSSEWKDLLEKAGLACTHIEHFTRDTEGQGVASYIGVEAKKR